MTAKITIEGGLTSAPELRYSANGTAIASGTIASTERYQDKAGEWKDGKTLYLRYSAFRDLAENIGASALDKGAQVVVTGKLHTRSYETREGEQRSSVELEVTDFAVSLKRATAQVSRAQSNREAPAPSGDAWNMPQGGDYSDGSPF